MAERRPEMSAYFVGRLLACEVLLKALLQGIPPESQPALRTLLQRALREAEQSRATMGALKEPQGWTGFSNTLKEFLSELDVPSDIGH